MINYNDKYENFKDDLEELEIAIKVFDKKHTVENKYELISVISKTKAHLVELSSSVRNFYIGKKAREEE